MKKVRLEQDVDPEMENNHLSLVIQAEIVSPTIRVPNKRFSGMFDSADHVAAFKSHMDFYGATNATKCQAFSSTFRGVS